MAIIFLTDTTFVTDKNLFTDTTWLTHLQKIQANELWYSGVSSNREFRWQCGNFAWQIWNCVHNQIEIAREEWQRSKQPRLYCGNTGTPRTGRQPSKTSVSQFPKGSVIIAPPTPRQKVQCHLRMVIAIPAPHPCSLFSGQCHLCSDHYPCHATKTSMITFSGAMYQHHCIVAIIRQSISPVFAVIIS
jgi:hypothetical protein